MNNREKVQMGTRINAALALREKRQKDLAKSVGVTDNTVSYWCGGQRLPNLVQLIRIADYLKVSTDYLLGLTDAMTMDKDLQYICDYTGLSEDAVCNVVDAEMQVAYVPLLKSEYKTDIIGNIKKTGEIISKILSSEDFYDVIAKLIIIQVKKEKQLDILSEFEKLKRVYSEKGIELSDDARLLALEDYDKFIGLYDETKALAYDLEAIIRRTFSVYHDLETIDRIMELKKEGQLYYAKKLKGIVSDKSGGADDGEKES